jgi:hypothetical protein
MTGMSSSDRNGEKSFGNGIGNGQARRPGYIPGYAPTLIRADVKDRLTAWRRQHGYQHSEHIERCISSAALFLCLTDPDVRTRFLAALDTAVVADARAIRGDPAEPLAAGST